MPDSMQRLNDTRTYATDTGKQANAAVLANPSRRCLHDTVTNHVVFSVY